MTTTEALSEASCALTAARNLLTQANRDARPVESRVLLALIERAHSLACDVETLLADINADRANAA